MRTLGIIVASAALFIALLIGGAIAWWKINYPTYTYRYRMTVEVEENGKLHTGSSVIEVRIATQPHIGPALYVAHGRGEAVFVDLGKGRNVIALLATEEYVNYPANVVPTLFDLPFKDWAKLPSLQGTRDVPDAYMPIFVTFMDLNDPKSARVVQPAEFPQVFGAGVQPPKVTIEVTSNPVTKGIEINCHGGTNRDRPAEVAYRAWLNGQTKGPSIEPETLFKRGRQ